MTQAMRLGFQVEAESPEWGGRKQTDDRRDKYVSLQSLESTQLI